VRLLLFLGAAAKFPFPSHLSRLDAYTSQDDTVIAGPVVIVAGGTDSDVEKRLKEYQGLLLDAFDGYQGTIVSGATTGGISGLVGAVPRHYPARVTAIGYLPSQLPEDANVDSGYGEIRRTEGGGFSAREPLQYWADLIAAGVDPKSVKLLGINGG